MQPIHCTKITVQNTLLTDQIRTIARLHDIKSTLTIFIKRWNNYFVWILKR